VAALFFADTAFWIALASRRDEYHERAAAWSRYVVSAGGRVHTTEPVLWEWLNGMSHPAVRSVVANGYRQCHQDDTVHVVGVSDEIRKSSVALYESRSDKAWSLTDCMSFVVMKKWGIQEALTSDRHFEQAGFQILLRELPPPAT